MLQSDADERDEMRRNTAVHMALQLHSNAPLTDASKLIESAKKIEAYLKGERNGQI